MQRKLKYLLHCLLPVCNPSCSNPWSWVSPASFYKWGNWGLGVGSNMPGSWLGHSGDQNWNLQTPGRRNSSHSVKLENSSGTTDAGMGHPIKLLFSLIFFLCSNKLLLFNPHDKLPIWVQLLSHFPHKAAECREKLGGVSKVTALG